MSEFNDLISSHDPDEKRAARIAARELANAGVRQARELAVKADRVKIVKHGLKTYRSCGIVAMNGANLKDFWAGLEAIVDPERILRLSAKDTVQIELRKRGGADEFDRFKSVGELISKHRREHGGQGILAFTGIVYGLKNQTGRKLDEDNHLHQRVSEMITRAARNDPKILLVGRGVPQDLNSYPGYRQDDQSLITRDLGLRMALLPGGEVKTVIAPEQTTATAERPAGILKVMAAWGEGSH